MIRRLFSAVDAVEVSGYPLHAVNTWVQTWHSGIYYVAACGAKGYTDTAPVADSAVDSAHPRCPLCFFRVAA